MSSQDVVKYLCEVGSNERKLDYCRQILAANTNFIPECVFNLKDPMNTNTQTKSEFIENIRTLTLGCNPQEEALLFNYFQIDGKNYITFGQFTDQVVPQGDNAMKKVISMRRKEDFVLDYSLRYCLQKYFFQIIQNQVKLQLMCKFTFPKDDPKRLKNKRLDISSLTEFMNIHGRYPDPKLCQLIVSEMGLNKGECKRHKLITEFIHQYNDQFKKKETLPEVIAKESVVVPSSSRKNKENTDSGNKMFSRSKKVDFTGGKSQQNPLLKGNPLNRLANSSIMQGKTSKVAPSPLESIGEVERRISSLMSEVNLSRRNSSPIKQMYKKDSGKEQLRNSVVDSIREEIQRQKISRVQSKIDNREQSRINPITQFKRTNKGERNFTDRQFRAEEFEFDAVTEKNETDRAVDSRSKIKIGEEKDPNTHSQLIYKPRSRVQEKSPSPEKSKSMMKRFDYKIEEKKEKQQDQYSKRIQYLKSLIDEDKRASKVTV